MAARIITLLTAVLAELNAPVGVTWSQTFTATRHYVFRKELKDIGASEWLVAVVPAAESREMDSRQDDRFDLAVQICIHKKIDPTVNTQSDAVLALAEEFSDYWMRRAPATMTGAKCIRVLKAAPLDFDNFDQFQLASITLQLNFDLLD